MTTNSEYLHELAERGDGSLAAWFASEHVETQNGGLDGARDTANAKNARIAELEEELRSAYGYMLDISDSLRAEATAHER